MSDISVRLTGDNSQYRAVMDDSLTVTGNTLDRIENRLFGTRAVAAAIGTALGLNLRSIADNIARLVTGFSKQEEDSLKSLDELTKQSADLAIRNMEARLTPEQKYQLALQERAQIQANLDAQDVKTTADKVARQQMILDMEEKDTEIIAYQMEQAKARAEAEEKYVNDRLAANDKLQEIQLNALPLYEKATALQQELEDSQTKINSGMLDASQIITEQNHMKETAADLEKAQIELVKMHAKEEESVLKVSQEYSDLLDKDAKDNEAYLILQQKAKYGLSQQDEYQLQLYQLQFKQKQNIAEIDDLLAKQLDGTLTPQENTRLNTLIAQKDQLATQLATILAIINATTNLVPVTAAVTSEYDKQVADDMALIQDQKFKTTDNGKDNTQLTDAELQAKIANLKAQAFNTQAGPQTVSPFSSSTPQQDFVNSLQPMIAAAQAELTTRTQFRQNVSAFGTDAALAQVSPFDQQRFQGYLGAGASSDALSQVAAGVAQLNQRLENTGQFPTTVVPH